MYIVVTFLVLAALVVALAVALFVVSVVFLVAETGAKAMARNVCLHAQALWHVRLRPQESPHRNEMRA